MTSKFIVSRAVNRMQVAQNVLISYRIEHIGSFTIKVDMADSSDEMQDLESMSIEIPNCEGLPRRIWNTKCVTLYNMEGKLVDEGTCHSVKSNLVVGANGPLGDSHVAMHICRIHSEDDISKDDVYALVAWPTKLVHYHDASLHDYEVRDNFNQMQAALTNVPLSKSKRPLSEHEMLVFS